MDDMDTDTLDTGGRVKTPLELLKEHKDDLSEKHIIDLHKIADMRHNSIDLHNFDKRTTELDGDIRSNINNLGLLGMRREELVKRIHSLYNHQNTKDAFIRHVAPKPLVDLMRELELLDNQLIPEYITLFEKTRIEYDGCKELVNVASALTVSSKFLTTFDKMSKDRVEQIETAMRLTKDMTETMINNNRDVIDKVIDNNKKFYEETISHMQSKIDSLEEKMQGSVAPAVTTLPDNDGAKADAQTAEMQRLREKIKRLEAKTAETSSAVDERLKAEQSAVASMTDAPAPVQDIGIKPTGNEFVDAMRQEPDRMEKMKKIVKDSYDETGNFRVMNRSEIKDLFPTDAEKRDLDTYKFSLKQQRQMDGEPDKKEDDKYEL